MKFQVNVDSAQIQEFTNNNVNTNEKEHIIDNTEKNIEEVQKEKIEEKSYQNNWSIEIPEINLTAEIAEGTSAEIMNKYVGHFEDTKIEYGNIGLAAHNRGYPVNYFQDLKKLKEGNEIIYKHGDYVMTYEVKTIEIIENTDWSYLKNTEDNRITLITCVENEPKYRRCIQGVEKIESEEY